MTEEDLYKNSFHNKFLDIIKNKWIIMIDPDREGNSVLYYITGQHLVEYVIEAESSITGYRAIITPDRHLKRFESLDDYGISLNNVSYSLEVTDKLALKELDVMLARYLLTS